MLKAARVQIPQNNLDNPHSSREEDGTSKLLDPRDVPGSILLELKVTVRGMVFLRGISLVVVILVKGHAFPTNENFLPVDLGYDRQTLVELFSPIGGNTGVLESGVLDDPTCLGLLLEDARGLVFESLFFGVKAISLSFGVAKQGQVSWT
ncbi:hypothetical protein Tco_0801301 [Tanacetum coccineum]|uniref:Uncharacterized protein n=1 Tax=Tanacetum coccineum TaxID=301880 RepID=A0ABQ4ZVP2_9ASTR